MTTKQRAYLKGLAMNIDPIFQIGKGGLTTEYLEGVEEALEARELIKINVLKNCLDEPKELAYAIAENTLSEVVQVIGRKIVLYREARQPEKRKIVLPK
ncbi:MAG: ribosome assembly RNA-binding protein YhbY [Lachnospiraceae bacterium]|nr:ribosome assembly RNA-binding protein YhbY [Lachnospiraceae bacterium]MBQ8316542.1 ribosome assembly RNA-binding protein YhbY [Lachnospiraceae bacterium]MBQ8547859.1 ribosome assembly RNA-binding protein YhbY [Lachnospiraceae bacterium]MBQ8845604.1 ribosome assembly RNA-binding protein YhbY [Lachnospiraceae bacterium]